VLPITGEVQPAIPGGRRMNRYSHNFCDKTTWYQDSARVTDETLTDSGNHLLFTPAVSRAWVDVTHGKVFAEQEVQSTYKPVIKVDGATKAEHSPGTTNGDYGINYATGAVTFESEQTGTVTATYSYAQSSLFKVQAVGGCILRVGYVEVSFSKDVGLKDDTYFQLWGNIGQGMQALSSPEIYRTWDDFVRDSMGGLMDIQLPTGAGDAWRLPGEERWKLRFDYRDLAGIDLDPTYSMEIRMWLANDIPHVGGLAHATLFARRVEL
jgi:hypothetical protein